MIPPAWAHLRFFSRDWPDLSSRLAADPRLVLPPADRRFAALTLIAPADVRVVILGQDPYPTPGHAQGLAFSVPADVRPLPRSLSNIFKELEADVGAKPATGNLEGWAKQGVLLLNSCLTVPAGEAGGHAHLGWQVLIEEVLAVVAARPTAFVLWGAHAQALARHITGDQHLILKSPHPSPLSARRGFFGSRPFGRVNDWLVAGGGRPIDWAAD